MKAANLGPLERWRLLLGDAAETALGDGSGGVLSGASQAMDRALDWLYGRDDEQEDRDVLSRERAADLSASALSVPEWINQIHTLFPKETIERLERDAVEHYKINELITQPEVLQRVQPSQALLEAVLHTKHLMNPEVLAMARNLVAAVVRQLIDALAVELQQAFSGVRNRRQHTRHANARNFDAMATLRANLKHYDPSTRRLVIERALFNSRSTRHLERWQIILVVDQSGSMVSSVIHSAVTAACLSQLPGIDTHLLAFDTEVVNLTDERSDPVELLMKVQLGGGTDIQKAMRYAAELVDAPRRAIIVLISDFYEGAAPHLLVRIVRELCAQGSRVLGLAALDQDAVPAYDRDMARKLVEVGAEVGAMTPGQLARWLAEKLKGGAR
ncbi:VWA domain-containing protein [Pseudomarimonas arenosa]|uniref:VWA domain-containing protein n=1 Tax=Pseudomarimonas arenosa TaxID=2774145 RepID=A0AAW3ZJ24_9GAMM|nr:VWA domain-containing protein [Pseudomarimonas arenosa]MBD8524692.1 VWA domain-containing protein [Pseudomarimonas arenosa]